MFAGGVDTAATETKGTVLIHTAEQVNVECSLHVLCNVVGYICLILLCLGICVCVSKQVK